MLARSVLVSCFFSIVFKRAVLERLAKGVFFEVLNQLGDSVGVGPGFAPVVAVYALRGGAIKSVHFQSTSLP
jgi:hypothetical protein